MLADSGREWDEVTSELEAATGALDGLAVHLLERWLDVIRGGTAAHVRAAVPAQQGMGLTTFNGLMLETAPGQVMTPRRASERLVAAACARIAGAARVADVGTGSGAIAVAIAHFRPRAEVWATDIDERAVALARANVDRHGLADRVFVRLGDLLEPVPGPVNVIVANLPYLAARAAADYPDLLREPFNAVFSSGDGLELYRRLVAAARTKIAPEGTLLLQLQGQVVVADAVELPRLAAELPARARAATRLAAQEHALAICNRRE